MCSTGLVVLAPSPGRMEALGTEGVFIPAQERDEMCRGIRPVSVITESPGVTQEGGSYRSRCTCSHDDNSHKSVGAITVACPAGTRATSRLGGE